MNRSLRISSLLIAVLLIISFFGILTYSPSSAQPIPIQITDIEVPNEVAQGETGQVKATVHNPLNQSFDGFAQFSDDLGEIITQNPLDPLVDLLNFTIGPEETLDISLNYSVTDNATLGMHMATFEINVGGFSFLLEQYDLSVISVATITSVTPGHVFTQGQVGILLVTIENRIHQPRSVRIDAFGPKFVNASKEVDLSPGQNNIVIEVLHNASHVYDFGMSPINVSLYYNDEQISSEVILVPVDMTLLNKALAVILPAGIFLLLVVFYAFRKRKRIRALTTSE